jgi:hypothetical protein
MSIHIPDRAAWGALPTDDLDLAAAFRRFYGKTNEQLAEDFKQSVIERADDLRWMPPIPFQYYILGYRDLLVQQAFGELDAPDAASCYLRLIEQKLESAPETIAPVMPQLLDSVAFISENQALFDADPDIYGDFREKRKHIEDMWANAN